MTSPRTLPVICVNEGTEGPPIWEVAEAYIRRMGTVDIPANQSVIVTGG